MTDEREQVQAAIWAELIIKAHAVSEQVRVIWARQRSIGNVVFGWVSEELRDAKGHVINDAVILDLPPGKVDERLLLTFAKKVKPVALLLLERRPDRLVLTLESLRGCRTWTMPFERHGDIDVLGPTVINRSPPPGEGMGLLWRPAQLT